MLTSGAGVPKAIYQGPNSSLGQQVLLGKLNTHSQPIAIDVETISLEDTTPIGIGVAISPQEAFYFPTGSPYIPWHLLRDPGILKIVHNGHFDLSVIRKHFGIELQNVVDTIIAAQLLGYPPALGVLADLFFGIQIPHITDLIGKKGKGQLTMDQVPIHDTANKCALDTMYAYKIWERLSPSIPQKAFDLEMRVMPVIMDIQERGMRIDTDALDVHIARISKDVEFYRALGRGMGFNPGSSKQLAAVLEWHGYPVRYNRKTGNPVLNEEMLKTYYSHTPVAQLTLLYRGKSTLLRNTLIPIRDKHLGLDGRIHARINQNVVSTGRFSTSKPNVQNITASLRNIIIPDEGDFLEDWDLSQIELRVAAYLSQDPIMLGVFARGGDIHSETSMAIFGDAQPHNRRIAKDVNFAMLYGGDEYTLYSRSGVEINLAARLLEAYFRKFRRLKEWIEETRKFAHVNGYTETMLGRRRSHMDINSPVKWKYQKAERELINHPIQGSAGEILKELTVRLASRRQVNLVHDESLMQRYPGEDIDYSVVQGLAPFPTPADVKTGQNWRDVKEVLVVV